MSLPATPGHGLAVAGSSGRSLTREATPSTPGGASAADAAVALGKLSEGAAQSALAVNSAWEAASECDMLVQHARERAIEVLGGNEEGGASRGSM